VSSPCSNFGRRRKRRIRRREKKKQKHEIEEKIILSLFMHAIVAEFVDTNHFAMLLSGEYVVIAVCFVLLFHHSSFRFDVLPQSVLFHHFVALFSPMSIIDSSDIRCYFVSHPSLFRPTSIAVLSNIRRHFVQHPSSFRSTSVVVRSFNPFRP